MEFNISSYYKAREDLLNLFHKDLSTSIHSMNFPLFDCDTPFAVGPASFAIWNTFKDFSNKENLIDPGHALLSLRQERYLEFNSKKVPIWDQFSGIYVCLDDELIQLHCNFSNHLNAALKILKFPKNVEEARDIIRTKFKAKELEQLICSAGGVAGVVSKEFTFEDEEKLKRSPLVTIQHSHDQAYQNNRSQIRVVDLTRVLAGPICTRTFKDILGDQADVITITSKDLPQVDDNLRLMTGLGKRTTFCDFNNESQLKEFKELLKQSDVFVQSFHPGCLDKYNLKQYHPGVVVNIQAFQFSNRKGFDSIMQCLTGMYWAHSNFVGKREHLPVQALDHLTGLLGTLGALVALRRRKNIGGSFNVTVSLERTAYWLIKELPKRTMNHSNNLVEIENRLLSTIRHTRTLPSGNTLTLLKGVFSENDESEFPEPFGQDRMEWMEN